MERPLEDQMLISFFNTIILMKQQFWIVRIIDADHFDWFVWPFDTEWFGFILSWGANPRPFYFGRIDFLGPIASENRQGV